MPDCTSKIEIQNGTIEAINYELSYERAIKYCEDKNKQLASIHDSKTLDIVKQYLDECYDETKDFGVGLQTKNQQIISS